MKSTFGLLNLLVSAAKNIYSKEEDNVTTLLPSKIGKYRLVKDLTEAKHGEVSVGLYSTTGGKKVVAKIWFGHHKDYSYHSLRNEYLVYDMVNKLINRISKKLPTDLKAVHVPKLVSYTEYAFQSILLIEWIEGKTLESYSDKKVFDSYFLVSRYLDFLSNHILKSELKSISTRTGVHYIFLYPLLLIKALLSNFKSRDVILRGIPSYLKMILPLLFNKKLSLVHRDLHFKNIIVSEGKLYIIDFQLLTYTYKVYEYVSTLRYCWDKNRLKRQFYNQVLNLIPSNQVGFFKSMIVFFATHGLISTDYSEHVVHSFESFLLKGVGV
jgi:hypothetical protein